MGTVSLKLPINVAGRFEIADPKIARRLLKEIETHGKAVSVFDGVLGIWADRQESEPDLVKRLRDQSNRRDG